MQRRIYLIVLLLLTGGLFEPGRAEVILQYFNTSWNEIAERMPELAEAGYSALWLPPPFKAGSQFSVGFDTFDRFDIGTKNQMGGVPTRYGTGDDLKNLVEVAHRFGIRVYFDNVMAHNGGPIPGYDENTPITVQPGFVPEDFHLLVRPDGTYRKRANDWPNWSDEWQILNRNPFGLDIAQEKPNDLNVNHGPSEGSTFPKWRGFRQPNNPEYYLDTDLAIATNGAGDPVYTFAHKEPFQDIGCATCLAGSSGNRRFDWNDANSNGQHDAGEDAEPFTDTGIDPSAPWRQVPAWGFGNGRYDMGNPDDEDVNQLLFRAARWFMDQVKADGMRLDAVRHVPSYFFGQQGGADKDSSNAGYCGHIQEQFNVSRGFNDWNNHRNSCFNDRIPRDDALFYGETLGEPPGWDGYVNAGMRVAHDGVMNKVGNNIGNNLAAEGGMDQPGFGSYGVDSGMMYLMSHDQAWLWEGHFSLGHAMILTRAGLPIVYTDGFHHSGPPNWFPKWSTVPFLGQWNTKYMLNELDIHRNMARGDQEGRWHSQDFCAYERLDWREVTTGDAADACVLLFAGARGYTSGQSMEAFDTTFRNGDHLFNYSYHGGGFYAKVQSGKVRDLSGGTIFVPSGGYFAFSWRSPEPSLLWSGSGGKPITLYENGKECGTVGVVRRDGEGGDANFNPYNVPDTNATDYSYTYFIPRITDATNLRFVARVDGSAANVLMKLDAGVDLNASGGRDNAPGNAPLQGTDLFVGYEQPHLAHRQYPEKFAAVDTARNKIGSAGAETYLTTIGSGTFTTNLGNGVNDFNSTNTASWIFHDPNAVINATSYSTTIKQFEVDDTNVTLWAKMGTGCKINHMYLYYTVDGATYPEGAGGEGRGQTRVAELDFVAPDITDPAIDWWRVTIALTNGTPLRYKIGGARLQGTNHPCSVAIDVPFPNSTNDIARKTRMMAVWEVTNFNAATVSYYPHGDYGVLATGLEEGFHVLSARAFLSRGGRASIYNTFLQTFYLDAATPSGFIRFPATDGETLFGSQYGVVVRGDRTVEEVWYRITDSRADNDDSATAAQNGNAAWVKAVQISADPAVSTVYPSEWRFDYVNIPSSNSATIEVRLRELSSSTNMALDDASGHFTTLTRTVVTRGPDVRLFVLWPQADNDIVGPGYVMKAAFSKLLADGISSNDLLNLFTLRINSNLQARTGYNIVYNETPDYHAFAFSLPNLYDGFPAHQHHIEVSLTRDPYPDLTANRRVRAQPVEIPYIDIVTPPALDESGQPFQIVLPDVASPAPTQREYTIRVETAATVEQVRVIFALGTGTLTEAVGNPGTNGNYETWDFLWTFPLTNDPSVIEGTFQLRAEADTDNDWSDVEAFVLREVPVVLRELVGVDTNDLDDDDDGLPDYDETVAKELPAPPTSTWSNSQVHAWAIFGRTEPLSPDGDGDGLPDGLELGWRVPLSATDTNVDTDGDGFANFISDLDPPFYNTGDNYDKVPGVSLPDFGNKTDLKAGTVTDPNNADTDFDGLPDGLEDANRNGWVDGDGAPIQPTWEPWLDRDWPDRSLDASDTWLETDPDKADTDKDGLSDGHGEDKNYNGYIDGDANSNRVYDAGEAWIETDPLDRDTDGDSLPDGWEVSYSLDALDNGTNSLRQAGNGDGSVTNGPAGDPDNDGVPNLNELISGTNPRVLDTGAPAAPGAIIIGEGSNVMVGAVVNKNEFTDWSYTDLIALDNYDLHEQSNGGDVYYRPWASDGLESSRDLVAFYAHDGGSATNGGDGNFYFRVDLHQLQALAEDSGLNIYVVIDTGNQAIGERKLVDNLECLTDMRWEVTVAAYDGNNGTVFVNKPGSSDTSTLQDQHVFGPDNVDQRTKAHAEGFRAAYFNSELDSAEFSISRQALLDAGWNGNISALRYQVFTTRDGVDLDGPDIQDSIRTDWIAEDFAGISDGQDVDGQRYQGRIALTTLSQWVGFNADNDRGKRIKVISIVHGNQHDQPGRVMQNYVNNGLGAGYYRPLEVHEAFRAPLTMHITPTLASALQWAKVDTNVSPAWRDGPAINAWVARLIATNVVDLLASTFSDHMMPYYTPEFTADNVALASEYLTAIYGPGSLSTKVFWTPERVMDTDVLDKIIQLGFVSTVMDQGQHLRRWFGFNASIGEDGYRINQINGVKCFAISGRASDLRFSILDSGPSLQLREILNRRARTGQWSGQHPQVLTFFSNWEDFADKAKADAYDKLIRWFSNKGWIQIVTPDQVLNGELDISLPPDGSGDTWNVVNRGAGLNVIKTGNDWIEYSSQTNLDNWYLGSSLNQSLYTNRFPIRPGTNMPAAYGMLYSGGVVSDAWGRVDGIPDGGLSKLARSVIHAAQFETAFHNQSQTPVNMAKYSTGEFAYPDSSYDTLIDFAKNAQSQARLAAVYDRVDEWAAIASSLVNVQTAAEDVDLDGEEEYLLFNNRVFGLFERIGGRLIAAWVRDIVHDEVFQASGNFVSYPGREDEQEGTTNILAGGVVGAFRTSCLKDWWAGTAKYVNELYTFTDVTNGWRIVSTDNAITKQVTLGPHSGFFDVAYTVGGSLAGQTLYVRNGLAPNLYDLLLNGQETLGAEVLSNAVMRLANTNYATTVEATLGYGDAGHSAAFNAAARDDGNGYTNYTLRMRNQAQTHQVEVSGTGSFAFALGFKAERSDWDHDGIPNTYEDGTAGLDSADGGDGNAHNDGDQVNNVSEYVAGTDPNNSLDYHRLSVVDEVAQGLRVRFPTKAQRTYYIYYSNSSLLNPAWTLATSNGIPGTGGLVAWVDDGTVTSPHPSQSTNRIYRVDVGLPR